MIEIEGWMKYLRKQVPGYLSLVWNSVQEEFSDLWMREHE